MSGLDKWNLMQELKAAGWVDDARSGQNFMRPPAALIQALAGMSFHVYDAQALQDFVSPGSAGTPPIAGKRASGLIVDDPILGEPTP